MITRSATTWLGFLALVLFFGIGAGASAQAAAPTPISACPYTITAPGNYVVMRDLTAAGSCIQIGSGDIGLDLGGHTISGNGTGDGIIGSGDRVGIANGTIQKFGIGVLLISNFSTLANLTVRDNKGGTPNVGEADPTNGILFLGSYNTITESAAIGNTLTGIVLSNNGSFDFVSGTKANSNGRFGILAGENCTIVDTEVSDNGINGIDQSAGAIVGVTARGNGANGMSMGGSAVNGHAGSITNSNASGNGGDGISLANGNVSGSVADNNGFSGIVLDCPGIAIDNRAHGNVGGNIVTSDNTCVLLNNKTQ